MENESLSNEVLKAVGETIQKYPVSFRGAQIISGEDEGAYGWITINYLLDSFTKVGFILPESSGTSLPFNYWQLL